MLDNIEKVLSIAGSSVTVAFGVLAYLKRDKVSLMFRYLQFSYFSERSKRLKETLGKLEALDYNVKESRPEILALLGQISGQMNALENGNIALTAMQTEIGDILCKKTKLSEPTKRRILHSIHSAMDASALTGLTNLPISTP